MVSIVAIALGSSLMITSDGIEPPSNAPSSAGPASVTFPTPSGLRFQRKRKRHREIMTAVGVGLELGSALFYALTAVALLGDDLHSTKPSGVGSQISVGGGFAIVLLPIAATAMGFGGATSLASGREAAYWRSSLFWSGAAVEIAAYGVGLMINRLDDRTERLVGHSVFVAGAFFGTVMQVWGTATAPAGDLSSSTHALSMTPGCAPAPNAIVCSLQPSRIVKAYRLVE